MTDSPLTCEIVDRDDMDQRYLAGTLPPADAEAFEQHYFGCERCWALVQRGLAVRSAADRSAGRVPRDARFQWRVGLAAALALSASAALLYSFRERAPGADDAARGANATIVASVLARGDSLTTRWRPVAGATDYRVRVSAPDGTPLLEGETADSTIAFAIGAASAAHADTVYISVLARDALRHPIASSALTPLVLGRR
jgi:anti-sigma factor RsiW